MPTIEQIRAARALLGWSQHDLADKADLSQTGIARIENGTNQPNSKTITKIETAFDAANVEFIGSNGVQKRTDEIRMLEGRAGFMQLMDEIYDTANQNGGLICLHNAKPSNWHKWLGEEVYKERNRLMSEIKTDFEFRITTRESETNLISTGFAEYRLIPDEMFNDQSIYAYADNIAFINFKEDGVTIRILKNKFFTDGFRTLFNLTWDNAATKLSN